MKQEDLDYADYKKDFAIDKISFEDRINKPYFYYQFALDRLNEMNCLSVLDVGCADGVFSKLCMKQGLDVLGVEISPIARGEYLRNTGKEALENMEQVSLRNIDVIAFLECLEHLSSPLDMLKKGWELANKMMIFTVPIGNKNPSKFHKQIFNFYSVYNLCSKITDNFKIYMISKGPKYGNLNLFACVLYKEKIDN